MAGQYVYTIIREQAQAWRCLSDDRPEFQGQAPYLFVGSGSSYYLAKVACAYAIALGLACQAVPAAEVLMDPDLWLPRFNSIIIISRSGTTTEALLVAQLAKRYPGCHMAALTSHQASPLARLVHHVYAAESSDDGTVVMIRSFTSMLVLIQGMLSQLAGAKSTECLTRYFPEVFEQASVMVESLFRAEPRRIYVLGGGVRQGIADEGVLKMQEMAGATAFAFNPMEFRHGPWGSLTKGDVVVLLAQRSRKIYEQELLADLQQRQARVVLIGPAMWFAGLPQPLTDRVILPDAVSDLEAGPLAVVPLQLLAWKWALINGQDPDAPRNLNAVVVLKHV